VVSGAEEGAEPLQRALLLVCGEEDLAERVTSLHVVVHLGHEATSSRREREDGALELFFCVALYHHGYDVLIKSLHQGATCGCVFFKRHGDRRLSQQ